MPRQTIAWQGSDVSVIWIDPRSLEAHRFPARTRGCGHQGLALQILHAVKRHSQVAYLKFFPFRFCMQVHDIFRVDAGDIGHTLVGQEDQPSQIVLGMPKLARVVKQVAEDRGVGGDHRCRRNNR
jgi:hypothetical protein